MIVKVKPIKKETWSRWLRYPKCHDTIAPYLSKSGKGVVTGLTPEDETRLEEKLKLGKGELSPFSDFWTDFKIIMSDKELVLDTSNPLDELRYLFCRGNKRVRNAPSEIAEFPYADYVIADEEQEAKKENVKVRSIRKAYAKFGQMSTDDMRDILKLYGKKSDSVSNEMIENILDKLITEDPDHFLSLTEDKRLKTKVLVEDCLRYKVLRKNGTNYMWGDEPIGHDLETAVLFLDDLKNQSVLLSIKTKLEANKNK